MKISRRIFSVLLCVAFMLSSFVISRGEETLTEAFDINSGMYTQTFAGGRQFMTSLPNNAQTYDGVILNIPADITATLYYNGSQQSFASGQPISRAGYYTLNCSAKHVLTNEDAYAMFTFRIAGDAPSGKYNSTYDCNSAVCVNEVSPSDMSGFNRFTFPNHKAFYSSLAGYDTTVESAVFIMPANVGYSLVKNGSVVPFTNNRAITSPGSYTLNVYAKNYGADAAHEFVYWTALSFTIPDRTAEAQQAQELAQQLNLENVVNAPETVAETVVEVTTAGVVEDTLTEVYNQEAEMYKETFSTGDAFYTNTANGSMTGGNVYIDIPSNMTVAMTKDGIAQPFVNEAVLNEQGTYVLNITDNYQSRQYSARYSFRIQNGVEESEQSFAENDGDGNGLSAAGDSQEQFSPYSEDYTYNADRGMFEYTLGGYNFYTNLPNGMFSNEGLVLDIPTDLTCRVTRDGEEYQYDYRITDAGHYEVSVNDVLGNSMVLTYYLYDTPMNVIKEFIAPGNYRIVSLEYEDYKDNYVIETAEEVSEEITEETTNGIHIALDGSHEESTEEETTAGAAEISGDNTELIEEIRSGIDSIDSQIERAGKGGLTRLEMPLDGKYTLTLSGVDMPDLTTVITLDTTAPSVGFEGLNDRMRSTGNEITLFCYDDEVTLALYSEKGEENIISENGGTFTIDGVGDYTLVAVDKAGNQSEYSFTIVRHIGAAGYGAIALFAVLIIGLIAFIMYNMRRLSVR